LNREDILSFYGEGVDPNKIISEGFTEEAAARRYVDLLVKRAGNRIKVLLIAPAGYSFPQQALELEIQSMGIDDFERGAYVGADSFDAIIFHYQLEKSGFLAQVLGRAFQLLKEDGVLFVISPSLDSYSAKFFGVNWTEWRPENRHYFDNNTIQSVLLKNGFDRIVIEKDSRWYTFEHIYERAVLFPNTWITRSIRMLYKILPSFIHQWHFRLPSSGMILSAQKGVKSQKPLLSIVMPVYNESATFANMMEQLLAKNFEGVDREIIIVESNSTDNSRDLVKQYQGFPNIKVVLQEKALGKGNAVREGFEISSGDILIIQDADLEYDINDYEALLEPILLYKKAFVLGARHGGRWKMRNFNDQQQLSAYFNFGHVLFTFLINIMFGQRMKDPFTMFKVFRKDCLYNLVLECNRFDFDFELVIKLIRKGYTPLEIPVNYDSRTFAEGKKVRMLRDPLTWIRALIKYRFSKITKDGSKPI